MIQGNCFRPCPFRPGTPSFGPFKARRRPLFKVQLLPQTLPVTSFRPGIKPKTSVQQPDYHYTTENWPVLQSQNLQSCIMQATPLSAECECQLVGKVFSQIDGFGIRFFCLIWQGNPLIWFSTYWDLVGVQTMQSGIGTWA